MCKNKRVYLHSKATVCVQDRCLSLALAATSGRARKPRSYRGCIPYVSSSSSLPPIRSERTKQILHLSAAIQFQMTSILLHLHAITQLQLYYDVNTERARHPLRFNSRSLVCSNDSARIEFAFVIHKTADRK